MVTTSAQLSVEGFRGFRAGDGPWHDKPGSIEVPVGEEGGVVRFEATTGRDVMARWFMLERGHSYRVVKSACAGIALRDLAKPKRRPFVQIDAHALPNTGFPLRWLGIDGKELDSIEFPDAGAVLGAPIDAKCPDLGARLHVVDAAGETRLLEHVVVPNERVTRVTLSTNGTFSAIAFDAANVYFREEVHRIDPVTLSGLRIEGQAYGVRHTHGGEGAKVSMAIFAVKNGGKNAKTLTAKSAVMLRDFGERKLVVRGVSFGEDESQYSDGGDPGPSVTIPPGETRFVRVHVDVLDVYLASIGSFFRWSVVFESGGKTATATVPLHVMRVDPLRR